MRYKTIVWFAVIRKVSYRSRFRVGFPVAGLTDRAVDVLLHSKPDQGELRLNVWMWFRLAAIVVVLIAGCFAPLGPRAHPPLAWYVPIIIFIFCPIAMAIVFGVQRVNPRSAKVWHPPSWTRNPFNFRDPIQFFHFGAIITIAQGVVVLARVSLAPFPFYVEALVPLAMGLGVWVGVRVIEALYRSKFAVPQG